jgi:hypothetical protein
VSAAARMILIVAPFDRPSHFGGAVPDTVRLPRRGPVQPVQLRDGRFSI